jgi:hypothetical protein
MANITVLAKDSAGIATRSQSSHRFHATSGSVTPSGSSVASTRRDGGGADEVGLDLLSQAFADHAYCRLGCRMDRASSPNDTASDRPHIDDVTTARAFICGSAAPMRKARGRQSDTSPRSSGECGISVHPWQVAA